MIHARGTSASADRTKLAVSDRSAKYPRRITTGASASEPNRRRRVTGRPNLTRPPRSPEAGVARAEPLRPERRRRHCLKIGQMSRLAGPVPEGTKPDPLPERGLQLASASG